MKCANNPQICVLACTPAVSPFFRQSPFRTFRQVHQPQIQVELFDEIVAAMRGDCLKKGDEWHTAGVRGKS